MNWLGDMLMSLFPPEKEPNTIMSDDMKRYHKYLGKGNSLRFMGDTIEMQQPGEDTWRRVPPLAEWLSNTTPPTKRNVVGPQ